MADHGWPWLVIVLQGDEDSKRTVSMSESVASTITAASEESMSSDDDDNGEDNGESSDTASAPSPAPLTAPGDTNHDQSKSSTFAFDFDCRLVDFLRGH